MLRRAGISSHRRLGHKFLTLADQYLLSATLAGHEDWVRTLAFKPQETLDSPLVLASGSQDATIRLWNIEPWKKTATNDTQCLSSGPISEILDQFEASLGDLGESEEGGRQISLKQHILTVKTGKETYGLTRLAFLYRR